MQRLLGTAGNISRSKGLLRPRVCFLLMVLIALPPVANADPYKYKGPILNLNKTRKKDNGSSFGQRIRRLFSPLRRGARRNSRNQSARKTRDNKPTRQVSKQRNTKQRAKTRRARSSRSKIVQQWDAAHKRWPLSVKKQLYRDVVEFKGRSDLSMSEYQRLHNEAVQNNSVDQMVLALRHRAGATQALSMAWRKQLKLYHYVSKRLRKQDPERAKHYYGLAVEAAHNIRQEERALKEFMGNIKHIAKKELAEFKHARGTDLSGRAAGTERTQRKLGWRESNKLFNEYMKKGDINKAFDVLDDHLRPMAKKGGFRRAVVEWKARRVERANRKMTNKLLSDQIHGNMDSSVVSRVLARKVEQANKSKNIITRTWRKLQVARWKRRLRVAAEDKMVRAVRDGDYRADMDLLQNLEQAGGVKAYFSRIRQDYKAQAAQIEAEGKASGASPQEIKAVKKDFRRQLMASAREQLRGSNFTQARKVLQHLDWAAKKEYKANKGVRGFVNRQVSRFTSWVVGSPLKSVDRAQKELLKRADYVSKRGIDGQLEAKMLLMTAKHLKMHESKKYAAKFQKSQDKTIKRLAGAIKQAVKAGDYQAVEEAYNLYEAYGMDSKLNEWTMSPRSSLEYKRDITAATNKYINMLTKQAEWILLYPNKAAQLQYGPGDAMFMNQKAERRADEFRKQMPGAVPVRLSNRIDSNKLLNDPASWKGKMRRFAHSGYNVLAWPHRIAKTLLMIPVDMVRRPRVRPPVDPMALHTVLQKMSQNEQQMMQQEQQEAAYEQQAQQAQQQQSPPPAAAAPAANMNNAGAAAAAAAASSM